MYFYTISFLHKNNLIYLTEVGFAINKRNTITNNYN